MTTGSFVFLRRKTKSKTTFRPESGLEVVLFCLGKTKQKTTRKPKAEASVLFCFFASPFRGRRKTKTKTLPASPKTGPKAAGRKSRPHGQPKEADDEAPKTAHAVDGGHCAISAPQSQRGRLGKCGSAGRGCDITSLRGHGSSPPPLEGRAREGALLSSRVYFSDKKNGRRLKCLKTRGF